MSKFNVGDLVSRKSHGHDIIFKISNVKSDNEEKNVVIKGIDYRIEADAPENDLELVTGNKIRLAKNQIGLRGKTGLKKTTGKRDKGKFRLPFAGTAKMFDKTGKILHLDGAGSFIEKCKEHYEKLGLNAVVLGVAEKDQPLKVRRLLEEYNPDILVLTGHDGVTKGNVDYKDISNYRNSAYFVSAVQEARKYERSLEDLVIFAGACQSNFEAILDAGANFCSSPNRELISMYDPVIVVEKVASAHIDKILSIDEVIQGTNSGFNGIGGLQTRGKARFGGPKGNY